MEQEPRDFSGGPNLSDWLAERHYFGRFYQSQGFNEKRGYTNDCGPTSLAVVVNMLLFQANLGIKSLNKDEVIRSSGLFFWERIPAWVPKFGGATAPCGLVKAFNHWSEEFGLDWHAERRSHARRAHIIENLISGRTVTALKIWKTGGAHWVNLVRYISEKDRLYFLDPNPYLEYLAEEKRLQSQSWVEFDADWSRVSWWSRLLGIRNEIITYSKSAQEYL